MPYGHSSETFFTAGVNQRRLYKKCYFLNVTKDFSNSYVLLPHTAPAPHGWGAERQLSTDANLPRVRTLSNFHTEHIEFLKSVVPRRK